MMKEDHQHGSTKPIYHDSTKPIYHDSTKPIYHDSTKPMYHDSTKPINSNALLMIYTQHYTNRWRIFLRNYGIHHSEKTSPSHNLSRSLQQPR